MGGQLSNSSQKHKKEKKNSVAPHPLSALIYLFIIMNPVFA